VRRGVGEGVMIGALIARNVAMRALNKAQRAEMLLLLRARHGRVAEFVRQAGVPWPKPWL